jgi:transcriptional regulator with XRE-family HTH domain
MTPDQCRGARALLRWSQEAAAEAAGISPAAFRNFERGKSALMPNNMRALERAFAEAGIEFIPGGVRRMQSTSKTPV